MKCRHCKSELTCNFIDLGSSPPSNSYLTAPSLRAMEPWYPLRVLVCDSCWLVQTEDFVGSGEMFSEDYAYFSSFSSTWLEHAKEYVEQMISRFGLEKEDTVVEVAANDGYLLQYVQDAGVNCYGIEPTTSTANSARAKGIKIVEEFFSEDLAHTLVAEHGHASLIAANNVLAHVPDINNFVKGFSILLNKDGIATFEFPHLCNLVKYRQFDTIYHEHYSYLSLTAVDTIFEANGLNIFDVEKLATHGGSLRLFAQKTDSKCQSRTQEVQLILAEERSLGVNTLEYYEGFQAGVEQVMRNLLSFLVNAKNENHLVIAYGAAAKGNTILNFSGVRTGLIAHVADRNPNKVGKHMPGSRIPIVDELAIKQEKPEYVLILPWNLKEEIASQLSYIRNWGGKFIIAIPELTIW